MKKKKVFSRIFAAVLAVAVMTAPLSSNGGSVLRAFADDDDSTTGGGSTTDTADTYSVKIISPDVPNDGNTYRYDFYQIFSGDVEEDNDVNIIANPHWGAALGGDDAMGSAGTAGSNTYALFQCFLNNGITPGQYYTSGKTYLQIYSFYAGTTSSADRIVLGPDSTIETLVTGLNTPPSNFVMNAYLRALSDVLWYGLSESLDDGAATYTFIDKDHPQASSGVLTADTKEYTVRGLEPGYYLVACVNDKTGALSNAKQNADGTYSADYDTLTPMSMMLVMVGPANEGVSEIVGKNATSVATVDIQLYKELVNTDSSKGTFGLGTVDTVFNDKDNWSHTQSLDWVSNELINKALLYRIAITLPQNFDSYKYTYDEDGNIVDGSGYFLAVVNQYTHNGGNTDITRLASFRPQVYVEHSNGTTEQVGEFPTGASDTGDTIIGSYLSSLSTTTLGNAAAYSNKDLGFTGKDAFVFGDLYSNSYTKDGNYIFQPGDTIYIYYPADFYHSITNKTSLNYAPNATTYNHLLHTNRVWAVYSNNPYADPFSATTVVNYTKSGNVAVSPIAEANVNNYKVTLKVSGSEGNYKDGAQFALYRLNEGKREYALLYNNTTSTIIDWISLDDTRIADNVSDGKLVLSAAPYTVTVLDGYSIKGTVLLPSNTGITSTGFTIGGLAAGTYYLEELTLGLNGSAYDSAHKNYSEYHYHLAQAPFKLVIEGEYNTDITTFTADSVNQFISKLTVSFAEDIDSDRYVNAYINTPANDDGETPNIKTVTSSLVAGGENPRYATTDGAVEVEVQHVRVHLIWLPETGGIGTMIFFIVGGVIVIAAVVLIVTRFRVKRERL